MSTFQVAKSMTRSLTAKEQKAIVKFWENNQELTDVQVIAHWEKLLNTPITHQALAMAMMNHGI